MANKEFKYGSEAEVLDEYRRWCEDCGYNCYIYQVIHDDKDNRYLVHKFRGNDYELRDHYELREH